eukprot:COSAG02_NODE_1315_length_13314_cov_30.517291_2_plen_77_part_00
MLILAENVKSFQCSVQVLYRVHCESIIYCIHRIFANMVSATVRIDHFCTEIRTVTFDCTMHAEQPLPDSAGHARPL